MDHAEQLGDELAPRERLVSSPSPMRSRMPSSISSDILGALELLADGVEAGSTGAVCVGGAGAVGFSTLPVDGVVVPPRRASRFCEWSVVDLVVANLGASVAAEGRKDCFRETWRWRRASRAVFDPFDPAACR